MLTGKLRWLPLTFCLLCVTAYGQEMKLEPGNPVEREIAGGESQSYKISLMAGQFARFRLGQRAIDAALVLNAPDGKQLVEMNLTRAGDEESLSLEAAVSGDYHSDGASRRSGYAAWDISAVVPEPWVRNARARKPAQRATDLRLLNTNAPGEWRGCVCPCRPLRGLAWLTRRVPRTSPRA